MYFACFLNLADFIVLNIRAAIFITIERTLSNISTLYRVVIS